MQVLSRKCGEQVVIDDQIVVTVTEISKGKVKIGIDAPQNVAILCGELANDPEVEAFRRHWTAPRLRTPLADTYPQVKPSRNPGVYSLAPGRLKNMTEPLLDEPKHQEILKEERPRWQMIAIGVLVVLGLFFVCGSSFVP